MVIWRDIGVKVTHKIIHIKKIGGKIYRSFIKDYGDIPVMHFNEITGRIEPVVNNRGRAYAARARQMYRRSKRHRTE